MFTSNVQFCVYKTEYDQVTKRDVVASNPTVEHLYGWTEQVVPTLESEITNNNDEMSRVVRFRMITNTHPLVRAGVYVEITHVKHPVAGSWVRPDYRMQYVVHSVTPVFMCGTEVDVALIPKPKMTAPVPKNAEAPAEVQVVGYAD